MATMITSECINCGACEPECPNTAIYQGGVEWEHNGQKHAAISNDIFYIVPEKCTECVGFFDHEACAAVCPVDCCVPNPDIPESESVLLERAKALHPGTEFPPDFPSRFKGNGDGAAAPAATEAKPAAAPAAAAPAAAPAKAAAAPAIGIRTERPLIAPKPAPAKRPPRKEKSFPGELSISFDEAVVLLKEGKKGHGAGFKWMLALAQPILGALPFSQKKGIEQGLGDRRFFTAAGATAANALHNMILYPVAALILGALSGYSVFTADLKSMVFYGLVIASLETYWRMREGFHGRPADQIVYRGALYGLPLAIAFAPLVKMLKPTDPQGSIGQDGFTDPRFGPKLERERRYGEVYRLREEPNGYLLEVEFPRVVPPSGVKEQLNISDEMPDYDYDLTMQNGFFIVKGTVTDQTVRKVAAFSPAFPPDFTTQVRLPAPVTGFRHRFRGKDLEVALLKSV